MIEWGDFVQLKKAIDKNGRGHVIKIHPNGISATIYWEELKEKRIELLEDLTKLKSFSKGDLVTYKGKPNSWAKVKTGDIGIVTKVYKKAVYVHWTKLGKTTSHNLKNCYVKHLQKG